MSMLRGIAQGARLAPSRTQLVASRALSNSGRVGASGHDVQKSDHHDHDHGHDDHHGHGQVMPYDEPAHQVQDGGDVWWKGISLPWSTKKLFGPGGKAGEVCVLLPLL